ncbi:hypothetical protein [Chitinimonas sp.]|uniref:gliding motility protein GldB-related protein n=1 Tax=Chitinimonas sp. TaxID=1934313 RepID=UPI0035AEEB6B
MSMFKFSFAAFVAALFIYPAATAAEAAEVVKTGAWDPFSVRIQSEDAQRFAKLYLAQKGVLTSEALQRGYLDGAGRGVAVFTPQRIENAENLALSVKKRGGDYAYAIENCLPILDSLNAEMRAIYLALHGLLPEARLPAVYVVFGAGNSGGHAVADSQVIGLEVACKKGVSMDEFRRYMRMMFAHESVHSLQTHSEAAYTSQQDSMLSTAIAEGTADYIASIVLGKVPDPERDQWARDNSEMLWKAFAADRETVLQAKVSVWSGDSPARRAFFRWFANAGSPPKGWHSEAGYWIGRQIAAAFVERSPDKLAAIKRLLAMDDIAGILRDSGIKLEPGAPS